MTDLLQNAGLPFAVAASCLIEAATGSPALFRGTVSHPVAWIGNLISFLENHFNRQEWNFATRRISGILCLLVLMSLSGGAGFLLDTLLGGSPWGLVLIAIIGSLGIAGRNLYEHVCAVLIPLREGNIAQARQAVSMIVGRDTQQLDETGISTAACESLAESFNDGFVAPLFWFLIGGLCGLFLYKTVNTADSLIGHREPRWRAFGWAAARMDDLMNLIPARLAALLVIGAAAGKGWKVAWRDARKHASPNAGWPEAAFAGALQCRFGGDVSYDGIPTERPFFGDGPKPDRETLAGALPLYIRACLLTILLIIVIALVRL